jgi:hypothetical protein
MGWAAMIALLFPRDAFAYIDPGSGSLIFQTIVATLAGFAYAMRVYWGRIRLLFSRRAPETPASPDASPADPQSHSEH